MVLGILALVVLTDRPETASWLSPDERGWLADMMAAERASANRRQRNVGSG